jgi:1,3-beta-glucan synthase
MPWDNQFTNCTGSRYIATSYGYATARNPFSILYSHFSDPSIYLGMCTLIILLYVTTALWIPHLIYFWTMMLALCLAPSIFNPHQFSFSGFIINHR